MKYEVGGKITTKKPHACGCYEWDVVRTGADVKIKCAMCGRSVFVTIDKLDKMTKNYTFGGEKND